MPGANTTTKRRYAPKRSSTASSTRRLTLRIKVTPRPTYQAQLPCNACFALDYKREGTSDAKGRSTRI
jgi:hypothetical protein